MNQSFLRFDNHFNSIFLPAEFRWIMNVLMGFSRSSPHFIQVNMNYFVAIFSKLKTPSSQKNHGLMARN